MAVDVGNDDDDDDDDNDIIVMSSTGDVPVPSSSMKLTLYLEGSLFTESQSRIGKCTPPTQQLLNEAYRVAAAAGQSIGYSTESLMGRCPGGRG